MRIVWTTQARTDQVEIYETIAEDNPDAAERVYQQIEERVAMLKDNPRLGVRRPEIGRSVRMLVRGVYLIYYEITPDNDEAEIEEVEIVRVVHGQRDMSRVF
jgi:toxin ParE1/3/4